MTTIDPNKTIHKYRREEEMRKALLQLLERKHMLSVPPQVEDADMVLSDVIEELLEARKKLEQLGTPKDRTVILRWIEDGKERTFVSNDMEEIRARVFCLTVGQTQGVVEKIMLPEIQASAMITREEAEQAANAELTPYRSLPTSSLLYQIPVISTQEELREAKRKGEQYIFVANPGDSLKDIEKLREPVKDEEQVIDLPLSIPEETTSTTVYRGVGRSDGIYLGRGRWLEL